MSTSFNPSELKRLLAACCNETISSEEIDRLDALLLEDPQAREAYLEYSAVEAELLSLHSGVTGVASLTIANPARVGLGHAATYAEGRMRRAVAVLAIAASLIGVAAFSSWATREAILPSGNSRLAERAPLGHSRLFAEGQGARAGQTPSGTPQSSNVRVVAHVTATRDCRWAAGSEEIGFGASLYANQRIDLTAGLAEITFDDGSRLVLEGPAKLGLPSLDLASGSSAILFRGRLAATMAAGTVGAPVRTERLTFTPAAYEPAASKRQTNTGPVLGLSADGKGGEEVHVLRGSVDAFLIDQAEVRQSPVRLASLEAARVLPASTTLTKIFADNARFVRSVGTTGGPADGLHVYEGFDYPAGPLSGQNGGFGWAGAWADIEAACPPGEIATNVVEAGGLAFDGLRSLGGHATQRAQQNRIRRALSTSLGGVFDTAGLVENQDGHRLVGANGKTVYISFLQRVDRADDGFYGFELHRGDGNGNRVLCVGNGADETGYGATSNYNAYIRAKFARLGEESTMTNFFVVKVEFGQQNRDLVTIFRNPESMTNEKESAVDARMRGNFAFDRISFGNFDGEKRHEVDELRIGTVYRAVTGLRDSGTDRLGPPLARTLEADWFSAAPSPSNQLFTLTTFP